MSIISEERKASSPYIETISFGRTTRDGSSIRPAESHWHIVLVRYDGNIRPLVVGPWTTAGVVSYGGGAEILWIKLKLGTCMPHLPIRAYLNTEMALPVTSRRSFWLADSSWQFPDYDNADTFVNRLARAGVLTLDPVVSTALQGQQEDIPARTLRYRFKRSTGLTQGLLRQMERAQHAQALLQQGASILDTIDEAGYFDQPHLTRSLKHFLGYTPAQIIGLGKVGSNHQPG